MSLHHQTYFQSRQSFKEPCVHRENKELPAQTQLSLISGLYSESSDEAAFLKILFRNCSNNCADKAHFMKYFILFRN